MHDPMVVAHTIVRPWPNLQTGFRPDPERRWAARYSWAKWYDLRPSSFKRFWTIAGRTVYWPGLITIWHVEPNGHDSGEVCKHFDRWQDADGKWQSKANRAWKWHVHHWRIQVHPLQHLRRALLTRCEWCHGRSRKGDVVNLSGQWDRDGGSWWKGERGLYHHDCYSIREAHLACLCTDGVYDSELSGWSYGTCARCGKRREWRSEDSRESPVDDVRRILASIPDGGRDDAKTAEVRAIWAAHRSRQP